MTSLLISDARCASVPPSRPGSVAGFHSVLFEEEREVRDDPVQPPWFGDLNLDQVVAGVTAGLGTYDLAPFFGRLLPTEDAVRFRQEVTSDLDDDATTVAFTAFALAMTKTRDAFARAGKTYYGLQKQRVSLEGLEAYCTGVAELHASLQTRNLESRALRSFQAYLHGYVEGEAFGALHREVTSLAADLAAVVFDVHVFGGGFRVERHSGDPDYGAEVETLFAKFRQSEGGRARAAVREASDMNHVEAKVLEFVARLHPTLFDRLATCAAAAPDAIDPTLRRVDREMQFYLAYLAALAPLRAAGLPFCLPVVSTDGKSTVIREGFDLALAMKLVRQGRELVTNGIELGGAERTILVSGPNQGGKTTFARAFGQVHHLAGLGLPVPGREVRVHLVDAIHTHFEREENVVDRRGKLEDDLVRVHGILEAATPRSLIILNEIFSSTALEDAVHLAGEVIRRIVALDALCVVVTFLDELVALSPTIVSAVSTVVPEDPARRTFKVVRRPADGRSYALSIAEKHRLTYSALCERLRF